MRSALTFAILLALPLSSHANSFGVGAEALKDAAGSAAMEPTATYEPLTLEQLQEAGIVLSPDATQLDPEVQDVSNSNCEGHKICIKIHLGSQTMDVNMPGYNKTRLEIAAARPGKITSRGCKTPWLTDPNAHSAKYGNAPMKDSTFFAGNDAIHKGATNFMSHGCVHTTELVAAKIMYAVQPNKQAAMVCVYDDVEPGMRQAQIEHIHYPVVDKKGHKKIVDEYKVTHVADGATNQNADVRAPSTNDDAG
jgi:hypothetical protein